MDQNNQKQFVFSAHSLTRMFQRGITVEMVKKAVEVGDVIEDYPNDTPYPSMLISACIDGHQLHVVKSESEDVHIIITAYYPDQSLWDAQFKRRKS
ncbi:MAG: DUF4258 domain-containing protein [Bacteroidales bacterium]